MKRIDTTLTSQEWRVLTNAIANECDRLKRDSRDGSVLARSYHEVLENAFTKLSSKTVIEASCDGRRDGETDGNDQV